MKKTTTSVLFVTFLLLSFSFTSIRNVKKSVTRSSEGSETQTFNSLEGTWQLMAAKLAHTVEGESHEFTSESDVVSMKIFTRNRFVTLRYDRESHVLLGTGGGTYIQLGDQFTEYIDYHSWDSTLVDFPQTFTCTFEGDLFTQSGTIKGGKTDGQALEEVYQRLEDPFSEIKGNYPLMGSWKLLEWANGDVEKPQALPPGLHGFKLFTPTFFYAMRYRETGGMSSFAFGTYRATPDYLTETIISVGDLSAVGRSYTFTWHKTDKGFRQLGYLDSDEFMGYKIEEYYQRE
jgi:hypothetical protein